MPSHVDRIAKLTEEVEVIRTAGSFGVEVVRGRVDPRKFSKTRAILMKEDKQSADLLGEIFRVLVKKLTPDQSVERALNRLGNLVSGSQDPTNLRNQVFKVADELGIRLPSGVFASDVHASRKV